MNVSSGGLSFDFTATNDNLIKVISENKNAIRTLADMSKIGGKVMEAAFKQASDRMDQDGDRLTNTILNEREAIKALEEELKKLKALASQQRDSGDAAAYQATMALCKAKEQEINARTQCINTCYEGLSVLDQEKQNLDKVRKTSEDTAKAQTSLRAQLRMVREQLAQMEATEGVGVRQTELFKALQAEAGRLADAMADAQAQTRVFSDDNAMITGAIDGLNGVAGGFSAIQGTMALFGVESEKVQQTMLRVQSLMAITTGLQQVANALNKDSAFRLTYLRKAQDFFAASTSRLAVALGISNVAAKALMATLTLGMSAAITVVIALWDKLTGAEQKNAEQARETNKIYNEYLTDSANKSAELVSKYERLRQEYTKLRTEADKTKWLKDNASAYGELGLAIDGVTSADRIFIGDTPKVIEALELRAKAAALQSLQTKAHEEYYKTTTAADNSIKGGGYYETFKAGGTYYTDSKGRMPQEWKDAGVTYDDAQAEWKKGMQGTAVLTATQAVADKVNAYRRKKAEETNKKIHDDAMGRLKATTGDVEKEITDAANRIAKLGVLKPDGKDGPDKDTPTGNSKTETEKYAEGIAKRKALYQDYLKWTTSSDATVREAAAQEFAPLLEQGSTYLDFLQRQQEALAAVAPTETVRKKLEIVQNEIADATKESTLKDFQKRLETDLQACQTLGAMLDLLEQRRQAIAGDNTEVGDREREIIDNQEKDVKAQVKAETEALLQEYASYELQRLQFAESYARKHELLQRNLAAATTDEQRAAAQAALAALEEENRQWQRSKSGLYATLQDEYRTYQQQLADIQANYAKQRAEAEANGNISMVQMINQKEQEEISKLAATQLMASDSWNALFTDMERLSTTTISRLIKEVEANKLTLSAQLNPADLKAVNDQLERARQEIQQRNPFLALRNSLAELRQSMAEQKLLSDDNDPILAELKKKQETYNTIAEQMANPANPVMAAAIPVIFKDTLSGGADFTDYLKKRIDKLQKEKVKLGVEFTGQHELDVLIAMLNKVQGTGKSVGEGLKDSFSDAASSIQFISGCFDAVVGGMKKMGISMDEETEAILGDIGGIMEGAQNVAEGIASGNPLSIIQGSITLFSSAFDLFNSRDRKAEKSIKRHEEALDRLKNAYNELEHAVNKALGEEVYRNQSSLIGNLRKQQAELTGMITDEQSKKHTDKNRIEEWQEQYAELGRQISDIIDEITQSITQTSAKDLAGGIADALIEAFEGGEDAAKAFGEVADDVIKKAVVNALKLQMLERPLQNAIKQLQRDMGFDEEGNGFFNGLSETEQKRFKDAVEAAGANFQLAMDAYKDLFGQLDDSDPTTLSGAIKGASQESIDLLAGQTNAVRQNQVTQLALFRQQLIHVSNIDANVGVIAGRLLSILNALTSPAGTSLRSQGITD